MKKLLAAVTVTTLVFNNMCVAYPAGEHRIEIKDTSHTSEEGLTAQDVYAYLRDQIVVTAARKEQKVLEAPSAVTIITEDQIRESGAGNIPDVLRIVAGLDIQEDSSYNTTVGARGLTGLITNNILVMQDYRELHGGLEVGTNWKEIPLALEDIKRIEIIRGPGSALYGTNAFSGIIHIITKSAAERKGALLSAEYGERNSQEYRLGYGGGTHNLNYAFMAGKNKTNGYGKNAPTKFTDRYDTNLFTTKFDYALSEKSSLKFDGGYLRLVEGFPGIFGPTVWPTDNIVEKHHLYLVYDTKPTDKVGFTVRTYNKDTRTSWNGEPSSLKSPIIEKSYTGEIQSSLQLSDSNSLIGGVQLRTGSFRSPTTNVNKTHKLNFIGSYLQDEFRPISKLIFTPGVRYDHHSEYGSQISGRISAVYLVSEASSLRLAYNEAFRNPTPNDLFFDFNFFGFQFVPNTNLKPEEIKSYEVGFQRKFSNKVRASADVFSNRITNRMEIVNTKFLFGFPAEGQVQNVSEEAEQVGGELQIDISPASWLSGFINYSYQDVKLKDTKTRVSNAPFNKANVGITFKPFKKWSNTWLVHYIGNRTKQAGVAGERFDSYTITDVRLANTWLDNQLEFSVAAKNIFADKHYERPTFTKIGRTVSAQLSYKF